MIIIWRDVILPLVTLVPRDVASRAAKERCDAGFGVNKTGEAVYLDFASAINRYGKEQAHVKGLDEEDASW